MISRDIIHIPTAGISILVAVNGNQAKVIFSFCNPRDTFNRKIANEILYGRLQQNRPDTIKINYLGRTPRKDILFPIADFVRETLGYHFDSDEKKFYHPETFGAPAGVGFVGEMDVFEPTTRVPRSVQTLTQQIRNFVDIDLRPNLEAPFQRAPQAQTEAAVEAV